MNTVLLKTKHLTKWVNKGEEIMELFKKLNEEDGVTIIQVTHSEKNAAYGNRIIELLDGMIHK